MSDESSYVIATVAVTAFPATPQLDSAHPGFFSGATLGGGGDPDIHVSFDGTNVHEIMRGATPFASLSLKSPQYSRVWLKLSAAGSVVVKVAIERGRGFA